MSVSLHVIICHHDVILCHHVSLISHHVSVGDANMYFMSGYIQNTNWNTFDFALYNVSYNSGTNNLDVVTPADFHVFNDFQMAGMEREREI